MQPKARATAIREYKRLQRLQSSSWLSDHQRAAIARRADLLAARYGLRSQRRRRTK